MNIDQLRTRFPDENACREFFESIIWQNGRHGEPGSGHGERLTIKDVCEK